MSKMADRPSPAGPGLARAVFLLGFALSGFFDGVLLHQILQWHHLLSALGGDLRWQVAMDGWFHAGMYVVAMLGLWRLWASRDGLRAPGAGRRVAAWGLIGFGAWHVVDAVLSHWVLALHRIRMDVANPLAWDLGWLALFGLVPIALGLWSRGGGRPGHGNAGGRGRAHASLLALLVVSTGLFALRPAPGAAHTVIAFAPWVAEGDALRASLPPGAGLVWSDGAGVVVVANLPPGRAPHLYRSGALFVGGGALPAGCLGWRG